MLLVQNQCVGVPDHAKEVLQVDAIQDDVCGVSGNLAGHLLAGRTLLRRSGSHALPLR